MKSILFIFCVFILTIHFSCKKDTPWEINSQTGIIIEGNTAVINKDTEWKDIYNGDTIDYFVNAMVKVQGTASLTIKPGVNISFETPESGIRVEDNAALTADGSSTNPIIFTSRKASSGAWKGIIFASDHASNKLNYVNVLYAGSAKDEGLCDAATSVGLAKNKHARATITNCTIDQSGGNGLWVAGTFDTNLTFAKNIITHCPEAPVALTADNISRLDSLSSFDGNKYYIDVYNVLGSEITSDATIQNLNLPFRISGKVYITKTLTISPGCTFEFNTEGEITTTDFSGANHTGVIKAEGKGFPYKIIFKGVQSQPASWVGITITSPGSNSFLNCEISDGGAGGNFQNPATSKGNFVVGRNGMGANATIKYCKITNSGGYGIIKYKDSLIPSRSSNVNTQIAITFNGHTTYIETNTFNTNSSGTIGEY